jgi:hypothetical protein
MIDWEKRIDEIARNVPKWKDHLANYRQRHPNESMPQIMKKASFTRRMYVSKQVKSMIKDMLYEVLDLE